MNWLQPADDSDNEINAAEGLWDILALHMLSIQFVSPSTLIYRDEQLQML